MIDNWRVINTYINDLIESKIASSERFSFYGEVTETDGYYVSIKPVTSETNLEAFQKIPILQSKYLSPVVQEGDCGIALNLGVQIGNLLEGDNSSDITKGSYWVFVPLLLKSDFASDTNANLLTSPDLNTSLKLENQSVEIVTDGDISVANDGNIEIATNGNMEITTGASGNFTLETGAGGSLEIKGGTTAIVVGNQIGTLADVCTALIGMMDLLASGMAGSATTPTAYQAGKASYQAQINQIVG